MSPTLLAPLRPVADAEPVRAALCRAEVEFYKRYGWSLNPFPTMRETIEHLREEVDFLRSAQAPDWQRREAMTNVFLLGCALLNGVDDYLRGKTLRLPRRLVALAAVRLLRWTIEKLVAAVRWRRRARARHWRARWQA